MLEWLGLWRRWDGNGAEMVGWLFNEAVTVMVIWSTVLIFKCYIISCWFCFVFYFRSHRFNKCCSLWTTEASKNLNLQL